MRPAHRQPRGGGELVDRLLRRRRHGRGPRRSVTGLGHGLPLLPARRRRRPAWAGAALLRHGRAHRGRAAAGCRQGSPARSRRARPGCSSAGWSPTSAAGCSGSTTRSAGRRATVGCCWWRPTCTPPSRPSTCRRTTRAVGVPARGHPPAAVHRGAVAAVVLRGGGVAAARARGRQPPQPRPAAGALPHAEGSKGDSLAVVELLQGPEQRRCSKAARPHRAAGGARRPRHGRGRARRWCPTVETIRARFTIRRRGGGLVDRVLRALLGVEAKVRQYAVGSAFTKHVVLAVGMDGFNRGVGEPGDGAHPRGARQARRLAAPGARPR